MSEELEVVGQIKISFHAKGAPEVEILGLLPTRQMNALPIYLRRAARVHRAAINRNIKKVDMSDKGKKLKDIPPEELHTQEPEPQAGADTLVVLPPPLTPMNTNEFDTDVVPEEANTTKPDSEAQNGTDKGTADVHRDDEKPGSEASSQWQLNK